MSIVESIAIVIGLIVFEVVNSVDNAIVNAAVLKTMSMLVAQKIPADRHHNFSVSG